MSEEDFKRLEDELLNDHKKSESEILRFFFGVWAFIRSAACEVNRFLESQKPSVIFLVAAGFFILAEISARVAVFFVPRVESVNQIASNGHQWTQHVGHGSIQMVKLFATGSQYMQFAGLMIGVWALFRLIADAIQSGANHE